MAEFTKDPKKVPDTNTAPKTDPLDGVLSTAELTALLNKAANEDPTYMVLEPGDEELQAPRFDFSEIEITYEDEVKTGELVGAGTGPKAMRIGGSIPPTWSGYHGGHDDDYKVRPVEKVNPTGRTLSYDKNPTRNTWDLGTGQESDPRVPLLKMPETGVTLNSRGLLEFTYHDPTYSFHGQEKIVICYHPVEPHNVVEYSGKLHTLENGQQVHCTEIFDPVEQKLLERFYKVSKGPERESFFVIENFRNGLKADTTETPTYDNAEKTIRFRQLSYDENTGELYLQNALRKGDSESSRIFLEREPIGAPILPIKAAPSGGIWSTIKGALGFK